MWNFAGRQNDIQGNGELEHGNWLTGIPFIDNARLGDQSKLPTELQENKGHNVFYCLPLLLGLIGLFWQAYKNQEGVRQFWVVFFLFFMTGLAIVVYLNQTPLQPRERDYAYAGSFYAFAIWVGMGVAAIVDGLRRLKVPEMGAALVSLLALFVPIQMAGQTWDDHDRSNRYTCRDFGQNYLNSLPDKGNPVIFTNGDNDTFPLWYNQETEGVRTDARVCNLSYLQTDWYIDQMCRPAYDSPSLPISWKRIDYVTGVHEAIPVQADALAQVLDYYKDSPEELKQMLGDNPYELKNIIKYWILSDNPDLQIFPTDSIVVTVDKESVRRSGMMVAADSIPDVMHISLKGKRAVYKSEMMMLEMISHGDWERPLYMSTTVGPDNYGHLGDNFVQEGLACRITPFDTKASGRMVDTERMYDNMMNKFKYGGLKEHPDVYLDETVIRMCYTHRRLFAQLAQELMREGKADKALKVVQRAEEELPPVVVPHEHMMGNSVELAEVWLRTGHKAEGGKILEAVGQNAKEYLDWYLSLSTPRLLQSTRDCLIAVVTLGNIAQTYAPYDEKKAEAWNAEASKYAMSCHQRGVSLYR